MTNFIWHYLRNQWLTFLIQSAIYSGKEVLWYCQKDLLKSVHFLWPENSPISYVYCPSQQERERNDPHKILKMGSLHWVIIPCYEIQKLGLATELHMQKWLDNLFAQWGEMYGNLVSVDLTSWFQFLGLIIEIVSYYTHWRNVDKEMTSLLYSRSNFCDTSSGKLAKGGPLKMPSNTISGPMWKNWSNFEQRWHPGRKL